MSFRLGRRLSTLLIGTIIFTVLPSAGRAATPSGQVGSAMALLATLEDAQVLPPEGTPEANRVIKIVIQFQSVFMKSADPSVRDFFRHALAKQFGESKAGEMDIAFYKTGWTSPVLEALDVYRDSAPRNEVTGLVGGFSQFNVTSGDFEYLLDLFRKARLEYQQRGQDIHRVFAERRQGMPGAKS